MIDCMIDWSFTKSIRTLIVVIAMVLQSISVFAGPGDTSSSQTGLDASSANNESSDTDSDHGFGPYAKDPKLANWSPKTDAWNAFLPYGAYTGDMAVGLLNDKYRRPVIEWANQLLKYEIGSQEYKRLLRNIAKAYVSFRTELLELPLEAQANYSRIVMQGAINPKSHFQGRMSKLHTPEQVAVFNKNMQNSEIAGRFKERGYFPLEIRKHNHYTSDPHKVPYLPTILHRGFISLESGIPENSFQAMLLGMVAGYKTPEIDAMMTWDGRLLAAHGKYYNSEIGDHANLPKQIEEMTYDEVVEIRDYVKLPLLLEEKPTYEVMKTLAFQPAENFVNLIKLIKAPNGRPSGHHIVFDCRERSILAFMAMAVNNPDYIPYMSAKVYTNAFPGGWPQIKREFIELFGENMFEKFLALPKKPTIIPVLVGSGIDVDERVLNKNVFGFSPKDYENILPKMFWSVNGEWSSMRKSEKFEFLKYYQFFDLDDKSLRKAELAAYLRINWVLGLMPYFDVISWELSSLPSMKKIVSHLVEEKKFDDKFYDDSEASAGESFSSRPMNKDIEMAHRIADDLSSSFRAQIAQYNKDARNNGGASMRKMENPIVMAQIISENIRHVLHSFSVGNLKIKIGRKKGISKLIDKEDWQTLAIGLSVRHPDYLIALNSLKDRYQFDPSNAIIFQHTFQDKTREIKQVDFGKTTARTKSDYITYALDNDYYGSLTTDTPIDRAAQEMGMYDNPDLGLNAEIAYRDAVRYKIDYVNGKLNTTDPGWKNLTLATWLRDGFYKLRGDDPEKSEEVAATMYKIADLSKSASTLKNLVSALTLMAAHVDKSFVNEKGREIFAPFGNSNSFTETIHNPFDVNSSSNVSLSDDKCRAFKTYVEKEAFPDIDELITMKEEFAKEHGVDTEFRGKEIMSYSLLSSTWMRAKSFIKTFCSRLD